MSCEISLVSEFCLSGCCWGVAFHPLLPVLPLNFYKRMNWHSLSLEKLARRLSCRKRNFRAAPRGAGQGRREVPWCCRGGGGLSRLPRGGRVKSDLLHLLGNSSSCRSLPLSYPRQIRLLCESLLEAAAVDVCYKSGNKPSCNFILKPIQSCNFIPCPAERADSRAGRGLAQRHHTSAPQEGLATQGSGAVDLCEKSWSETVPASFFFRGWLCLLVVRSRPAAVWTWLPRVGASMGLCQCTGLSSVCSCSRAHILRRHHSHLNLLTSNISRDILTLTFAASSPIALLGGTAAVVSLWLLGFFQNRVLLQSVGSAVVTVPGLCAVIIPNDIG